MSQVQVIEYVEYAIQIPGIGSIFLKAPRGSPAPRVVVSETVAAESPVAPLTIKLPGFISRKRPSTISVSGVSRTVSACVAVLLEAKRRGDKLRARPETIRKFEAELPELAGFLKRDESRKGHGGMVPVLFGVEVG